MTNKKRIEKTFRNYGIGHRLLSVYNQTIKMLEKQQTKQLDNAKNGSIDEIKRKYQLTRICSLYNIMTIYFGTLKGFDETFLLCSASRSAMVSNGIIFYYDENNTLHWFAADDKNFGKKIKRLEKDLEDEGKSKAIKESIYYWGGCVMLLPDNCVVDLGFNSVYPKMYIRSRANVDKEIFLEELSWNVTLLYDSDFASIGQDTEENSQQKKIKQDRCYMNNDDFKSNMTVNKSKTISNGDYGKFDLKVLENIENCNIVIELPYTPVKADILLKTSFKGKGETEIVLSTT